jgi:putative transposase
VVRTKIIPCKIPRAVADALNAASGAVYTGVVVHHWRTFRRSGHWLSRFSAMRWSDRRQDAPLHAHSIDAAQEGFYKACDVTRSLRKAGIAAKFPYHRRKYRTTIWKNTAIRRKGDTLVLSNGRGNNPITIRLPAEIRDALKFLEVRLVYDKVARRYDWHIVHETGKSPKPAPGTNVVSVDLGEIHPAVVGDENEATVITCRARRAESQGHARRLANITREIARKKKGSKRYKRLVSAKVRMKAKHDRVMRDMEHKISRAIVSVAVEREAQTIVIGDVRDVADGVDCGARQNQKMSHWNHGKVRKYVEYKAEAEGMKVELEDEAYTSQTCPSCSRRHKPKGRRYRCPACGFQAHRDVVGQVNILSRFKHGEPGKIPAPAATRYRIPHNVRVMRRCQGTGQVEASPPVARRWVQLGLFREAAGL